MDKIKISSRNGQCEKYYAVEFLLSQFALQSRSDQDEVFPMSVRNRLQIVEVNIRRATSRHSQNDQELLLVGLTPAARFLDPYCGPSSLEMHHPSRVRVVEPPVRLEP